MKVLTNSLLFILFMFFFSACNGGENTTGIGPDPVPDPPAEMASVPIGTPTLFIETSEDASVFNDIIGEFIEGSQQNFVQFVPETGEAALIGSNTSRSFAQSFSFIRSFDDELYLMNISDTGARIKRFNTDALFEAVADIAVPTPQQFDSMNQRCFAVIGDDLYYKVAWREAPFPGTGFADGPLIRVSNFFTGGETFTELIAGIGGDSPSSGGFVTDACYLNMDVADGVWYDYEREDIVGAGFTNFSFTTHIRDASTGVPIAEPGELVLGVTDELGDQIKWSNIAYDNGFGFMALLDTGSLEFAILKFDPGISSVTPDVVHTEILTGVNADGVHSLDAEDGFVSLVITTPNTGKNLAALFNPNELSLEIFDFGVAINQLQLIYRAN